MIIPSFQKSISIHSLHTEGDDKVRGFVHKHKAFQSTPSTRRETLVRCIPLRTGKISIHSLHTEGDIMPIVIFFFSPAFQSTPSTRRETVL